MITFSDGKSTLEIDLASWDGDAYLTVKVNSRGYCGVNDLHIFGDTLRNFCTNLVILQKNLKGLAALNSISPGELFIEIKPYDSLGHISVIGKMGDHIYTAHSRNWHFVEFGFEVDPQQLDNVVKVGWVQEYSK